VGPSDGEPCAYLNASGTGVESTDYNSSPGECSSTEGVWYPDGGGINVSPDGTSVGIFSAATAGSSPLYTHCQKVQFVSAGLGLAAGGLQVVAAGSTATIIGAPAGPVLEGLSLLAGALSLYLGAMPCPAN
jgi:hypothetical protein